jgi:glucokinase
LSKQYNKLGEKIMSNKGLLSIGIDIGGTKISAAVIQNSQIVSEVLSFKTGNTNEGILQTVLEAIETLKGKHDEVSFVGIATAGTIDLDNSKVTGSTGNLPVGYREIEFKKIIEEKFGLKTMLENDANAAGYAEYKVGSAQGHNNTVVVTLGTGIGGGIIVDGKLLRGKSGGAAEVGHVPITLGNKRACTCGSWDCWEAYASGTGYAKNAREMAAQVPENERTGVLKEKNPEELTTYDIVEGLKKNDPFCQKVHELWEEYIVMGLAILSNIFDPDSIVVSGGMAQFVNFYKVEKELQSRLMVPTVKVLPAKAGNYAGIIGAGSLASEKFGPMIAESKN